MTAMNHRIDPHWDMARLQEELDGAVAVLNRYRELAGRGPLASHQLARVDMWSDFEHQLRSRMTVLGLTAELDALEAK